ncbi:MAG: BGTF surface domain-containing protein [Halolamina sp.]|uniref:BGTF surface domain-containing protein n=1 Tax=Halolamina sp. TaxID=1940283 RepID=UPI002FC3B8E3
MWAGQTVGVSAFADNVDVQLRRNTSTGSTLVVQKSTGADGFVTFDTAGRPTGDYFITNTSTNYNFELAEQDLSVDFAADSVNNGGADTTVDFNAESNRANYEHVLTATYEGSAIAASTLQSVLGGAGTVKDADADGTDELVVAGTSADTFTANFSGADAGNYTVTSTVNDTGVSNSTEIMVNDVATGQIDFTANTYQVSEGGIAAIDVEISGAADSGTMIIGDEATDGYQANVSFTDVDDDGEVTIQFNTYAAGDGSMMAASATGDDTATVDDQTPISALLAQGDYSLSVSTGDAAMAIDQPQDLGALVIGDRSTDSFALWTAPSDAAFDADGDGETTEGDIVSLIEDGVVTEADGSFTAGDYTIHQISASGLDGVVEAEGGLSGAIANGSVTLSIVQTNPIQNQDAKEINVSASNPSFLEGDGAYYVIIKSDDLETEAGNPPAAGDEYEATFTVANDRLLRSTDSEDHESVSATFEVAAPSTSLDSDPVQVEAAADQAVSGTTNYAPGTELTVRVRSTTDVAPGFFNTQDVTVAADGTFSASFDMSDQTAGDTFTVTVRKAGNEVTSADGEVVEAATATPTDTAEPDTETPTDTATATATDTATATATDTATATEPDTDTETTTTETPGFGVAVALVALLAAALLAGRREN